MCWKRRCLPLAAGVALMVCLAGTAACVPGGDDKGLALRARRRRWTATAIRCRDAR